MTIRIDPAAIKTAIAQPYTKSRKSAIYTGAVNATAVPSWPYLDGLAWGITTDPNHAAKHLMAEATYNLIRDGEILPNFVVRSIGGVTFRIDSVPNPFGVLCATGVSDGNSDASPGREER